MERPATSRLTGISAEGSNKSTAVGIKHAIKICIAKIKNQNLKFLDFNTIPTPY
jgi:hypothetical protein